jgi:hypothetical protein
MNTTSRSTADIPVYVFSSKNLLNIWYGYRARKWATSDIGTDQWIQRRYTISRDIPLGAYGLLYCSEGHRGFFSLPFRFKSRPTWEYEKETWPGEDWVLPFRIEPLGHPICMIERDEVADWPIFARSNDFAKMVAGIKAYCPSIVPVQLWKYIRSRHDDVLSRIRTANSKALVPDDDFDFVTFCKQEALCREFLAQRSVPAKKDMLLKIMLLCDADEAESQEKFLKNLWNLNFATTETWALWETCYES